MREDIIEKAYAKINISLDVTARRDDGYHDMAMVMQTVSLCDDVRLGFTDGSRIFARTNLPFIPSDERNLAVRAAKKFFEAAGRARSAACASALISAFRSARVWPAAQRMPPQCCAG